MARISFEPCTVEDQDNPGLYLPRFQLVEPNAPPRQLQYADLERLRQLGPDAWHAFPYLVWLDVRLYSVFEERGHTSGWMLSVD